MSRIKAKNTKPELAIRRLIHRMGYRYRLHDRTLPGKPDLVFAGRRKVVFVHGCFWHRHVGCTLGRLPKSRLEFWLPKLEANVARDKEVERKLIDGGWRALVIWECEVKDEPTLIRRIKAFLDDTGNDA